MSTNGQTIILDGECTIYEVNEKHQYILSIWTDPSEDIQIDLSKVTNVDASFLQLLISCKKSANEHDSQCGIINISDDIMHQIKTVLLDSVLLA